MTPAATATRSTLLIRSFFTDHLMAKIFALGLAIATVYIIDRELRTTWIDDEEVKLLSAAEFQKSPDTSHCLVLETEANVVVLDDEQHPRPDKLRMIVVGPSKGEIEFRKNRQLKLRVKSEWVSSGDEVRKHFIEPSDIDVGVEGATIELLDTGPTRDIWIDLLIDADDLTVQYDPPPTTHTKGMIVDTKRTKITPPSVKIRGPRSVIREIKSSKTLKMVFESKTSYESERSYQLLLPPELLKKDVKIVGPETRIDLVLKTDPATESIAITMTDVPVHVLMSRELVDELSTGASRMDFQKAVLTCSVNLKVPPNLRDDREPAEVIAQFKQVVRASIDLTKYRSLGQIENDTERPKIEVTGLPSGCELESTVPDDMPIRIERKN